MSDKVRVAVVGCGSMGVDLARQVVQVDAGKLVAVLDIDPSKAQPLADELGAEAMTTRHELLARDDVHAVFIATPGWTHTEWVVAAFGARKHVFVEKPMALLPKDCEEMIRAGKAASRKLMVGQVLRYIHVFAFTDDLVRKGRLGQVVSIRITRSTFGWGGSVRPWRATAQKCGGLLFEVSIHELDFMLHILGEASAVHSFANHKVVRDIDYPDTVMVNLQFKSGAVAQLCAGLADRVGSYAGEIVGTKGAVHFDSRRGEIITKLGEAEPTTTNFRDLDLEHPVRREVREFLEAVRDDTPVTIPGEDGLRVVRAATAAVASAATGRVVQP